MQSKSKPNRTTLITLKRNPACIDAHIQCRVLNPRYHGVLVLSFKPHEFIELKSNEDTTQMIAKYF